MLVVRFICQCLRYPDDNCVPWACVARGRTYHPLSLYLCGVTLCVVTFTTDIKYPQLAGVMKPILWIE